MNRQTLKAYLKLLSKEQQQAISNTVGKLPVRAVFEGTSIKELWDVTTEISKENNLKPVQQ